MQTILDRIVETKREEVAAAKRDRPIAELQGAIERAAPPRDFFKAVAGDSGGEDDALGKPRIIAEVAKASPSAGVIVRDYDPARIAKVYHAHGAAAISVQTDAPFYKGALGRIEIVRQAVPLPVARHDFVVDAYQIYESRAAGADAVWLMAELLGGGGVAELFPHCRSLGMTVLVGVHTGQQMDAVRAAIGKPGQGRYLLVINNQDLERRRMGVTTTMRLASRLRDTSGLVAEGGIATREDVLIMQDAGARAIVIGEALLRSDDPGAKLDELWGRS